MLLLLFHHQFIRFNNKQTVHVKKYLAFDLEKYLEFVPYSVLLSNPGPKNAQNQLSGSLHFSTYHIQLLRWNHIGKENISPQKIEA